VSPNYGARDSISAPSPSIQTPPTRRYPAHMNIRLTGKLERTILDGIASGKTLRRLCREAQLNYSTVYKRMARDPAFAEQMAKARMIGFDAIAEEILDIVDQTEGDWTERTKADGTKTLVANPESVARSKLRADTRLRLLAHWWPSRYGARSGAGARGMAGMFDDPAEDAPPLDDPLTIAVRLSAMLDEAAAQQAALAEDGLA